MVKPLQTFLKSILLKLVFKPTIIYFGDQMAYNENQLRQIEIRKEIKELEEKIEKLKKESDKIDEYETLAFLARGPCPG